MQPSSNRHVRCHSEMPACDDVKVNRMPHLSQVTGFDK